MDKIELFHFMLSMQFVQINCYQNWINEIDWKEQWAIFDLFKCNSLQTHIIEKSLIFKTNVSFQASENSFCVFWWDVKFSKSDVCVFLFLNFLIVCYKRKVKASRQVANLQAASHQLAQLATLPWLHHRKPLHQAFESNYIVLLSWGWQY